MYALERFKNGKKVALLTQTEEASIKLMEWCEENNILWSSGDKATEKDYWEREQKNMCYSNTSGMTYGRAEWYRIYGYEILPICLEDLLKELAPVFEND